MNNIFGLKIYAVRFFAVIMCSAYDHTAFSCQRRLALTAVGLLRFAATCMQMGYAVTSV